jgi:hypothetical protein
LCSTKLLGKFLKKKLFYKMKFNIVAINFFSKKGYMENLYFF